MIETYAFPMHYYQRLVTINTGFPLDHLLYAHTASLKMHIKTHENMVFMPHVLRNFQFF